MESELKNTENELKNTESEVKNLDKTDKSKTQNNNRFFLFVVLEILVITVFILGAFFL